MKRKYCISFILPGWFAVALAAHGITVGELQKELAKGGKITVIDVRSTTMFTHGHIPGAINIPAALCAQKQLPPLGRVVIYDAGLGRDGSDGALRALAAKPGITAEVLQGGFAAWEGNRGTTTRAPGMKPETPNYITYKQLKALKGDDVLLVDLREAATSNNKLASDKSASSAEPPTDLEAEFPGLHVTQSAFPGSASARVAGNGSTVPPLLVLIDNGDGKAQVTARALEANGSKRYVILAGGELILSRHGQAGLKREGSSSQSPKAMPAAGGTTN